jgi:large subunit ribosomal protein L24
MPARIKKGDRVRVVSGGDKGAEGQVLRVIPETNRVLIEGVNRVKRHQSPRRGFREPGIVEKEAPIDLSNVMLVDPKTERTTRLRSGTDKDGKKVRIAVSSGTVVD